MKKEPIFVTKSSMPDFEEYIDEIRPIWDSRWLTNMGTKHQLLETELAEYLDVSYVSLFTNGHLALEGMLSAFDFPYGSEVITTPFTFASTTHAIVRSGLVPVFCDVNENDYCLDPLKIESLITDKTVAILPVHVYGNICDDAQIKRIAEKYGLKVLYDAAHAFGVKYHGGSVASLGDASVFSFHATKVFNTIEGGAVCFSDPDLLQLLYDEKNFGIRGAESCEAVGGNAKMNEFQAAMGICNLRHVDGEIERRRIVSERYFDRLNGIPGIRLNEHADGVESNYAYFPVLFDGYSLDRDQVFEKLAAEEIHTRKYFYPITNSFPCYRNYPTGDPELTPIAKHLGDCVLCLPLYADLNLDDVERICDIILNR